MISIEFKSLQNNNLHVSHSRYVALKVQGLDGLSTSLFSLWGFDDSGGGRRGQKGVVVVDVLVPLRNLCKARTANGAGVGGRRFVGVRTFLRPLRLAL